MGCHPSMSMVVVMYGKPDVACVDGNQDALGQVLLCLSDHRNDNSVDEHADATMADMQYAGDEPWQTYPGHRLYLKTDQTLWNKR